VLELPSISYAAVVTAERTGLYVSELRRGEHYLKGAHAPRVLISAPSPKQSFREGKVRDGEGAITSTRGRVRSPESAETADVTIRGDYTVVYFVCTKPAALARSAA